MLIDSYTKLKPYNPQLYSPIKRPPKVGELAITLSHPRGYCCVVESITGLTAHVCWLDDPSHKRTYPLNSLIPTGKTPIDLLKLYEPTPITLDEALTIEREMIDFTQLKKRGSGSKKGGGKKTKKEFDLQNLTKEQKDQLANVLRQLMKGGD